MATIAQVLRNIKKIDVYKQTMDVVRDHNTDLLNANKKQLFGKGENKKGKKLKRYRNGKYAMYKNERNPAPGLGNPDLFNTGRFFASFKLKILNKKEFELNATDPNGLQKKYGQDILGLGETAKDEAIKKYFHKDLIIKIKKVAKLYE